MKINLKLMGIVVVVAGVVYAASERLFLDVDFDDVRFGKEAIDARRLHLPQPGDAYAYDHQIGDFKPTKICSLKQSEGELVTSREKLVVSNVWGSGINDALAYLGGVFGESVLELLKVDSARVEQSLAKLHFESEQKTSFSVECLDLVIKEVVKPNTTVFLVDTVYALHKPDTEGAAIMVLLDFRPVMTEGCEANCVKPVPVYKLLQANWFTRFKADGRFIDLQ